MKLAIFSDAPTIRTGLGLVSKVVGGNLERSGMDVVYLGHCQPTFHTSPTVQPSTEKILLVDTIDRLKIREFLSSTKPDAILLISSVRAVSRWGQWLREMDWRKPTTAYFVCDGLPVGSRTVEALRAIDNWLVPAKVVAEHLENKGLPRVYYAPFGIDHARFCRLPNRSTLKEEANLDGRFVIGFFGRNAERKQHPRLLQAIKCLVEAGYGQSIFAYIHSQPIDDQNLEGWDLNELVQDWGLESYVGFPDAAFDQLGGVPYETRHSLRGQCLHSRNHPVLDPIFHTFSYIERLNCCDLVINCSFSGGFELTALEAQACGVPLAITNDEGIFAELYGDSALLLKPEFTGIWWSGATQHFIAPETISAAILQTMCDPSRSAELSSSGLSNAERYKWGPTCRIIHDVLVNPCSNHVLSVPTHTPGKSANNGKEQQ